MNRDAPLIPIFWQNFRVHLAVEGVCYALNIFRLVRTNHLLCRIDLETHNFCRYLDNTSYFTGCFDVKQEKNRLLVVEYGMGNRSALGDSTIPPLLAISIQIDDGVFTAKLRAQNLHFCSQIEPLSPPFLMGLIQKSVCKGSSILSRPI